MTTFPKDKVGKRELPQNPTNLDIGAYKKTGIITYNGVAFPPHINSEISYNTIYDESGRQAVGTEIEVSVKGLVTEMMYSDDSMRLLFGTANTFNDYDSGEINDPAGTSNIIKRITADSSLFEIKNDLSAPGGTLEIWNKGLGSFTIVGYADRVNIFEGTLLDIDSGPKPQTLSINPINPHAVFVDWKCKAKVLNCDTYDSEISDDSGYPRLRNTFPLLGMSYKTSTSVNENLTTATTTEGILKFPRPFSGDLKQDGTVILADGTVLNSLDQIYRVLLNNLFEKTDQFMRSSSASLSEDKTSLSFTITDKEIASDNPYPTGVANIKASHKVKSGLGKDRGGFETWYGSLNVAIEAYPRYSKTIVWTIWAQLINALINQASKPDYLRSKRKLQTTEVRKFVAQGEDDNVTDVANNIEYIETQSSFPGEVEIPGAVPEAWITSVEINDDIFSRKASVNSNYRITTQLQDIIAATGILLPLNENVITDYAQQWADWSTPTNSYGGVGSLYQTRLDTAPGKTPIDVCVDLGLDLNSRYNKESKETYKQPGISLGQTAVNDETRIDEGFLSYDLKVELLSETPSTTYRPLIPFAPVSIDPNEVAGKNTKVAPPILTIDSEGYSKDSEGKVAKVINTGVATYRVRLSGTIHRVGSRATVPTLIGYGLKTAPSADVDSPIKQLCPVIPIGEPRKTEEESVRMVSLKDGIAKPSYITTFSQDYLVQGIPFSSDWVATGEDHKVTTITAPGVATP